jgi:hypothetical protein
MEAGPSVLEAEFQSDLPIHISESFKQSTNILELMQRYKSVFIPNNWRGIDLEIIGMEPISPRIKGTLPDKIPGKNYFINPKKMQSVQKELERLAGYFLEPSDSPYASPMVVAPKATDPFIRICGDYKYINQFIEFTKHFIKNVKVELEKIQRFTYFADMDMVNAFHQIRISKFFSDLLTILTPWGAKRPKFLPEGVNIAPGILQMVVSEIFKDLDDWMIVIYDNFLVLATSPEDLYQKLELVFQRCVQVNLQTNHKDNIVSCKHINLGIAKEFHVTTVKTFHCNRNDPKDWNMAMEIAKLDSDQYSIKDIVAYYGNPLKRYTTYYLVNFADGQSIWKQYDKDLFDSEPFYNFVHSNPRFPQLYPLEFTNTVAQSFISEFNKKLISKQFPLILPGVKFYLDIRYFDSLGGWYCNLDLPDLHSKTYVFECVYTFWGGSISEENHKWIHFKVKLTNETYKFNTYSVKAWGTHLILNKLHDINITRRLLTKYPQLLPEEVVEDNNDNDTNNNTI